MPNLLTELVFLYQRLDWQSVLDIALVTVIFFGILVMLRDTQAMVLLRGVVFLIIVLALFTSLVGLPAFTWLVNTTLPALVVAIPVIFLPEIRRALERLGRAGSGTFFLRHNVNATEAMQETIEKVVSAAARLSARQHGALIVLQRNDSLEEYVATGVRLNAVVTVELLLQIFYPNTPLHDGAVIIDHNRIVAAACVMPLSASGTLSRSPDRKMGLRHRAALGISEAGDAITVVVSEETGAISITHGGRMIRRLDTKRLENILLAFYRPLDSSSARFSLKRLFQKEDLPRQQEDG